MPKQKDLVSLILGLSAHEHKPGQTLPKDKEIEEAVSELVARADQAVPLLVEALDYSAFYRNYEGPPWHVPYDLCRLNTLVLGMENVRKTLIEIGDKAKPDLMRHITDDNDTIKYSSLNCLVTMGEAKTILQDKIEDGSLAHPNFIPVLSYILACGHTDIDGDVYAYSEEHRQMAYKAIFAIRKKHPKKSLPYIKEHYLSIIHGVDNPVEMLEMAADIFPKEELLMLRLSRCKKEERKAAAMEMARTGGEDTVKALIHMANGIRLYSPSRKWGLSRKPAMPYKRDEQLDWFDVLAETGSKRALRYFERFARYRKTEHKEDHYYWGGSLAWDGLVGSIVFPFAKGDIKRHLDRKSITLEVYSGHVSSFDPEKYDPNWDEKVLAHNDTYKKIVSSVERLKEVMSNKTD